MMRSYSKIDALKVLCGLLLLLVGAGLTGTLSVVAHADEDDDFSARARELSTLRTEVESLEHELSMEREAMRNELSALDAHEQELDLLIEAEKQRKGALNELLRRRREELEQQQQQQLSRLPLIIVALDRVEAVVETGIPFKREERTEALGAIRHDLQLGLISPEAAAVQLWRFVEDELRLCSDTGIYQQVIELDGEPVLGEVARLGMVLLYFRTRDDRVGHAVRNQDQWTFVELLDENRRKAVLALFDAMHRQVREGFFTLPVQFETGGHD